MPCGADTRLVLPRLSDDKWLTFRIHLLTDFADCCAAVRVGIDERLFTVLVDPSTLMNASFHLTLRRGFRTASSAVACKRPCYATHVGKVSRTGARLRELSPVLLYISPSRAGRVGETLLSTAHDGPNSGIPRQALAPS